MGWKNIAGNILDLNQQKEIDDFLLDREYKIKSLAESDPGSAGNVGHAIALPFRSYLIILINLITAYKNQPY